MLEGVIAEHDAITCKVGLLKQLVEKLAAVWNGVHKEDEEQIVRQEQQHELQEEGGKQEQRRRRRLELA